jgi:hypothetical protein
LLFGRFSRKQRKTTYYKGILASGLHYHQSFPVLANTGIYIYIYIYILKTPCGVPPPHPQDIAL